MELADQTECRGVYNGIFTKGLQSAFEQFMSLAAEVIAAKQQAVLEHMNSGSGAISAEMETFNYQQLRLMAVFIGNAFSAVSSARLNQLTSTALTLSKYTLYATVRVWGAERWRHFPPICERFV